jgi:hypothetical protein
MQPLIPSSPAAAATGGETNRFYLWASCLVAALGGLMFGYDWVVIGGTAAVRSLSEPLFSPLGRAKRSEDPSCTPTVKSNPGSNNKPMKTPNPTPIGNHLRVALKHSALAVAAGLVAGSAQAVTTTATYNLGTQVSPKTIESGIGGLLPWIAKGVLPTGSILKSVSIDAIIENVGNDGKTDDWAQDIFTPASPADHVKVAIPNPGTNGFVRLKVTRSN